MAISFDVDPSPVVENLEDFKARVLAGAKMIAITEASVLKGYMQRNRPWVDRSGEAKRQLDAVVSTPNDHTVRITLSHGVTYGKYLELAHGAKYAIIKPTIQKKGPGVYNKFNNFLNKLG